MEEPSSQNPLSSSNAAGSLAPVASALATFLNNYSLADDADQRQLTPFDSVTVPAITLERYIRHVAKRCAVSSSSLVVVLAYIRRIVGDPESEIVVHPRSVHRLFLASIVVSVKFCDDRFHKNSWFAKVGGVSLQELNALELVLLNELQWGTAVSKTEFADCVQQLKLSIHSKSPSIRCLSDGDEQDNEVVVDDEMKAENSKDMLKKEVIKDALGPPTYKGPLSEMYSFIVNCVHNMGTPTGVAV